MLIGKLSCDPAARRAVQKTNLDQERLVNLLDGVRLLRQRRRQRVHPHRAALIFLDDGQQQLAVDFVEPVAIDSSMESAACAVGRSM